MFENSVIEIFNPQIPFKKNPDILLKVYIQSIAINDIYN